MKPPKDDSGQVWFKLAQWLQRRRFLKKFTNGCQVMAIPHMTLWVRWAKKKKKKRGGGSGHESQKIKKIQITIHGN